MGFLIQAIVLGILLYAVLSVVCQMLWDRDTFLSKFIVGVLLIGLVLLGFGPIGWLGAYLIFNRLGKG